ncbi:MAG: hypothetical protein J5666_06500 [Bacilli bacterium]|nr:hypothetical protein [Bacilli bacterium]
MVNYLKKGFTLVEVVIMTSVVLSTVGFGLFGISSVAKTKSRYHIHYQQVLTQYNIIQIIKSDHTFYDHPEVYFGDASLIERTTSGTQQRIKLYFDKNNDLCDQGIYETYFSITCTPTLNTGYKRYVYSIQKYQKSINNVDAKQGGIINFTLYDA